MTLGSWFRSYVYIPLGGNRNGTEKTIRNLLIVWALTGLWHGASWNFILWGLYFGILIIIERLGWGKILEKLPPAISTLYTFLLVVFGWVLFDVNTLPQAFAYFKAMFGGAGVFADSTARYTLISNFTVFAVCIFASTNFYSKISEKIKSNTKLAEYIAPALQIAMLLMCTAYLVDATYNPFLYFRF